jgi:hypothetical protein
MNQTLGQTVHFVFADVFKCANNDFGIFGPGVVGDFKGMVWGKPN